MNKMKKELGFRINQPVPNWRDRFGKGGGWVKSFTPLPYLGPESGQVLITNGDILTSERYLYPNETKHLLEANK
jgi:hypothetical protein